MKAYIVMALAVAGGGAFAQERGEAVAYASTISYEASEGSLARKEVVDFLVAAADVRMMDMEEGSLAWRNGRSEKIKDYAEEMVRDQGMMLGHLKKMAVLRGIILPNDVSDERREGRKKLADLSGRKFDRKFVRAMILDHKRDLKLFKEAVDSPDDEVSEFAELYIPVIQNNLRRAKELRRSAWVGYDYPL
jgi:putative membrane protein